MAKKKRAGKVDIFGGNAEELFFTPLGGSEQFGVNLNVYVHQGQMLAIDCGVAFADHRYPGVDLLLPDPKFIVDNKDTLQGLIITHAHEDHIGAVPYLWERMGCPTIYCTEFTAIVLKRKFEDKGVRKKPNVVVLGSNGSADVGLFHIDFVHVTHSIAGAVSVAITTDVGRVLHTGDWFIDPAPVVGEKTNEARFRELAGEDGFLAYVGDSTNALVPGRAGSESDVQNGLESVIKRCEGRIIATIFSSNIGRIHSIAGAAANNGRSVAVIGRSLHNMIGCATHCGYMDDVPPFVSEEEAMHMADENIVYIVTGSQGEARAALARIARGDHRSLKSKRGDTVIFSSRMIPGNEKDIYAVINDLTATGAKCLMPKAVPETIHVSGHPYQDEIFDMWSWVRPKMVIPVHGEFTMLKAQQELALAHDGIEQSIVPSNGSVIKITKDFCKIVDHVHTGLFAVEPKRIIEANHVGMNRRRKLQFSGVCYISIAVDERGLLLSDPVVSTIGLIDHDCEIEIKLEHDIRDLVDKVVDKLEYDDRIMDDVMNEEIRVVVRRMLTNMFGFKPIVTVHLLRIEDEV